jgi:hypothetical protein
MDDATAVASLSVTNSKTLLSELARAPGAIGIAHNAAECLLGLAQIRRVNCGT